MRNIDLYEFIDLLGVPLTLSESDRALGGKGDYQIAEGEVMLKLPMPAELGLYLPPQRAKVLDSLLCKDHLVSSYIALGCGGSLIVVLLRDVRQVNAQPAVKWRLIVLDGSHIKIERNGGALCRSAPHWSRKEFYESIAVGARAEYVMEGKPSEGQWVFVPRARLRYSTMVEARKRNYTSAETDMLGDMMAADPNLTAEAALAINPATLRWNAVQREHDAKAIAARLARAPRLRA